MVAKVMLIGAGALGIRYLEGLVKVSAPLSLTIVDLSEGALEKARAAATYCPHTLSFVRTIPTNDHIDLAIVATTSGHRAKAVRTLLKNTKRLKYLLLEKILFTKKADYEAIGTLLKKRKIKTWVNHPRRLYPFHRALAKELHGKQIAYHIRSGVKNGLMTNATHYADYACMIAGTTAFTTDASLLMKKKISAKRAGYFELFGTLVFRFKNGSLVTATSLPQSAPFEATLCSKKVRVEFDETNGIARVSRAKSGWAWEEAEAPLLFQSAMTAPLVEEILAKGSCGLPDYATSATVHVKVLEPIARRLSLRSYPFT